MVDFMIVQKVQKVTKLYSKCCRLQLNLVVELRKSLNGYKVIAIFELVLNVNFIHLVNSTMNIFMLLVITGLTGNVHDQIMPCMDRLHFYRYFAIIY